MYHCIEGFTISTGAPQNRNIILCQGFESREEEVTQEAPFTHCIYYYIYILEHYDSSCLDKCSNKSNFSID